MVFNYQVGMTQIPLSLLFVENGDPVTGLDVYVQLRDTENNQYLDFSDNTWKSSGWTQKQVKLTDIGEGVYLYNWDSSLSVSTIKVVAAEFEVTTPNYEEKAIDYLVFDIPSELETAGAVWDQLTTNHQLAGSFGEAVQLILSITKRSVGLMQENFKLYDTVYDGEKLIAGKIRIYPSAQDVENDTNPIATYQIDVTYNPDSTCSVYKVKKL